MSDAAAVHQWESATRPPRRVRPITDALPSFPVVGLRVGQGIPLLQNATSLPRNAANFSTADAFVMTGCRV